MENHSVLEPVNVQVPSAGFELKRDVEWDVEKFKRGQIPRKLLQMEDDGSVFKNAVKKRPDDPLMTTAFVEPVPPFEGREYDARIQAYWPKPSCFGDQAEPLFMQFAKINGDISKAVAFANTYGPLGLWYPMVANERLKIPRDQRLPKNFLNMDMAEPLYFWITQSQFMNTLVSIYSDLCRVKTRGFEEIRQALRPRVELTYEDETDTIRCNFIGNNSLIRKREGSRWILAKTAYGAVIRQLLIDLNIQINSGIEYKLLYDPNTANVHPRLCADGFLTYLWYDFAQCVSLSQEIRNCTSCRALFVSNPSEKRKRTTCSNKCRVRAHRKTAKSKTDDAKN